MKEKNGIKRVSILQCLSFILLSFILSTITHAATANYTLDNVILDDGRTMTGAFQWTYTAGDFENGSGVFTDLYIPGHGTDIEALAINFDITKSIEFSLIANVHSGGVNVSLFLAEALTPTQAVYIDLNRSTYEIEGGAQRGGFISGQIVPELHPELAPIRMLLLW